MINIHFPTQGDHEKYANHDLDCPSSFSLSGLFEAEGQTTCEEGNRPAARRGRYWATLNGASIYGYNASLKLFVQRWPQIGLSNTSPASQWVTDSAAGMTAIVTGQKTNNGVLSESSDATRGEKDGKPLKTILEYAEERGLSTGVVTNVEVADATPAAATHT
jgi:hypothetical protein